MALQEARKVHAASKQQKMRNRMKQIVRNGQARSKRNALRRRKNTWGY